MTLVATVSPFGCPLMLGDILITGAPNAQNMAKLPTIGSLHLVDDSVVDLSRVAWLAQKICTINDNLAVGWSGSYEFAKRIISSMRAFPWNDQIELDDVQQCLATTQYDDQAAVSLVGVLARADDFCQFGLNAGTVTLPLFNECRIIGSGRDNFIQMARGMDLPALDPGIKNDPSWPHAIAATLIASAAFLGQEMNVYGGLVNDFGGGFEILIFENSKFIKLDDVLYCFWRLLGHNENEITLASQTVFVKMKYHDDLLVIRRADFTDQRQMQNDEFIVGPMAKDVTERQIQHIQTPDLNSLHDCHYVLIQSADGYEIQQS